MILQCINILCGVLLTSSFIKEKTQNKAVHDFLKAALPYEAIIGVTALALGGIGLIERFGIFYIGLPLGSSFPQALPAIFAGLILGAPILNAYSDFENTTTALAPYGMAIGAICILSGLGSLLFGCIMPIGCSAHF